MISSVYSRKLHKVLISNYSYSTLLYIWVKETEIVVILMGTDTVNIKQMINC